MVAVLHFAECHQIERDAPILESAWRLMGFANDDDGSSKMFPAAFPTVCSTLASEALVERVLSRYNIEPVVACNFWIRGLSDVYLVRTQGNPYILRVSHHHWRSRSEILFELELLEFLWQKGMPVAYPLHTRAGEVCLKICAPEGDRYAALFVYAPGELALGDLNPSQSLLLGKTLAEIHRATLDFRSPHQRPDLTLDYLMDASFEAIAPFLQHRPRDLAYLKESILESREQLRDFPKEPPFWVVCWGDPHSGNMHFTATGDITLFDFDQCGYGWRAFDIAKFLQISLRAGIGRKVRDAFLDGYQTVEAIADREVASLQAFTLAAHLWSWAISLNSAILHSYSRLDDGYFTNRLQQMQRLQSQNWQLF